MKLSVCVTSETFKITKEREVTTLKILLVIWLLNDFYIKTYYLLFDIEPLSFITCKFKIKKN